MTEGASVADVMSRDLLAVEPEATLVEVAGAMTQRQVGAVLVLVEGRLRGILTERDVLRAVAAGRVEARVGDWMTTGPETVEPDESAEHAAVLMIHGGFRHLPVLDGAEPVGIVSIRDLMRTTLADVSPRGV